MPFEAEQEPDLALQVEVAENEQRRDYTPAEVKVLAERLKEAGYIDRKDRPSKGEKPLLPALEVIVGKSLSTLKQYLQDIPEQDQENSSNELSISKRQLKQAHKALEKWQQSTEGRELSLDEEKLLSKLPSMLRLIQKVADQ
jgi:ParB family chromosome partitioning protein